MRILILLPVLYCLLCQESRGQDAARSRSIVIKRLLELKHYSPRAINDTFSNILFDKLINSTDPRGIYFNNDDYQQLAGYRSQIDDELNGNGWHFLDLFSKIYRRALERADSISNIVATRKPDYNLDETVTFNKERREPNWAQDDAALARRWSKYYKYQVLKMAYAEISADSTNPGALKNRIAQKDAQLREKLRAREHANIRDVIERSSDFKWATQNLFLNTLAECFDPHSNYFSPQTTEKFQAALSTEGYVFGIVLKENDKGEIMIDQITPGGPAWNSGQVNKGDVILSLLWEGKEAQDMTGASIDDAVAVIDQSDHDKLLFRLRKGDGKIVNVILKKEKAERDENIVKSFILSGDKKIGYIILPGFYTEWDNETGSSCANDVAREIIKLKKENIEGLILDVRYNGGGSMGEALDLTGIFIDEGPLVGVRQKEGKLSWLKDPNRGTIYDGPMLLMVNGQSASASEMLAAALQDYHRAVIAGSRTYGKATMQEVFIIDTNNIRHPSGGKAEETAKITIGKLYRVTGKTAQKTGVIPDITLPDAFDGLEMGERFEATALPADSVKPNNYYKPSPFLPIADLNSKSVARVATDPSFIPIRQLVAAQQRLGARQSVSVPLNASAFESWMKTEDLSLKIAKDETSTKAFRIGNHSSDQQLIAQNAYLKDRNSEWIDLLSHDVYLKECFFILTDLINSSNH